MSHPPTSTEKIVSLPPIRELFPELFAPQQDPPPAQTHRLNTFRPPEAPSPSYRHYAPQSALPAAFRCKGGCGNAYTSAYILDRHWKRYPRCEARHVGADDLTAEERVIHEEALQRRRVRLARGGGSKRRSRGAPV